MSRSGSTTGPADLAARLDARARNDDVDGADHGERHASERRIENVRALRAATTLTFGQDGTSVRFTVPTIGDYEVVALV